MLVDIAICPVCGIDRAAIDECMIAPESESNDCPFASEDTWLDDEEE